jgi:hypothetical protein
MPVAEPIIRPAAKRSLPQAKPLTPKTSRASAAGRQKKGTPASPAAIARLKAEPVDPLEHEDLKEAAVRNAPAWLVSMVVHMALLVTLGLLYVARQVPNIISLDVVYAEDIGVQLEDDRLQAASFDTMDVQDPALSLDKLPTDDPLAAPPDIKPELFGFNATDRVTAPSIGLALTGREEGMKRALLGKYGGTRRTEAAVEMALEWLKRQQRPDGSWSLTGPYTGGGFDENKTSATAMALLAYQGAGNTHEKGRFKQQVERGWRYMLKQQDRDGNFFREGVSNHRLYSQAQAMIAVCEIYGMTKDSMFKEPAQKAIDYAVKIQAKEGGWRYNPGSDSDTSVTGWFVMGLQSGLMAGLDVPSPTLERVSKYLDSVQMYGGGFYKYQPIRNGFTPAMTAEGLLCRQYLGWGRDDERLKEGVDFLLENLIDWADRDVYFWYYATQVLHHMEGEPWEQWNAVMREELPKHQVTTGEEKGSWSASGDRWGNHGGRLYTTCMCTFMLEVYYRHLPIYSYRLE